MLLYAIITAIVIVAAVLLAHRAFARLTPEQFMEAVRARIESAYPDVKVKEPIQFGWKVEANGSEASVFLDNPYVQYRRYPRLLNRIIDDCLTNMLQVNVDEDPAWADARHRLFPSIKPDEYVQQVVGQPGGRKLLDLMVVYDYKPGLKIILVLDSPRTMRMVNQEELDKWGVTREQALDAALQNLARITAPLWPPAVEEAKKSYFIKFDMKDGYDASRILLPDFHGRASRAIGAERIAVIIPKRDLLMAFDADHFPDRFRRQVQALYAQGDHSVSPEIYYFPEE